MNELSQAFGSALFFRILLPGLVLAAGIHPILRGFPSFGKNAASYPGGDGTVFVAELAILGMMAYASTIPAYHITQGLLFPWTTKLNRWFMRWRFDKRYNRLRNLYGDREYSELPEEDQAQIEDLFSYLNDFPIGPDEAGRSRFSVPHSTRLGNIVATYERYPDSRYNVNAEAFWNHFLFLIPNEVRQELENADAIAAGTLLSIFSGWIVLSVVVLIEALTAINAIVPQFNVGSSPASQSVLNWLAAYAIGAILVFNPLARVTHRQYGRLYRAAFDVHSVTIAKWFSEHEVPFDGTIVAQSEALRVHLISPGGAK
jgi:hypothetical protein